MNVTKSIVEKILISGVPYLDTISVILEDFNKGQGKTTISCFSECWSYGWGGLGEETMTEFFLSADKHYLARKFSPQTDSTVQDQDKIQEFLYGKITERRREGEFTKVQARDCWESVDSLNVDDPSNMNDVCYEIIGDEWWYGLPQKSNYQYEYLCRIIDTIKEALTQGVTV